MHTFAQNLSISKDDGRWLTFRIRMKKSEFRSSFLLEDKDIKYLYDKGLEVVRSEALFFFRDHLQDVHDVPFVKNCSAVGNPVLAAQNATATCCRKCIEKWHHLSAANAFSDEELMFLVDIVMLWICDNIPPDVPDHKQFTLF